jgi:hypothetical protein
MEFLPEPKTLDFYEVVEHEFSTAFANFINQYNLLELNIGLCIRSQMVRSEYRVTDKQLDTLSFHGKLERLTKLVDQNSFMISKKGLGKEYHAWLLSMNQMRTMRNSYIHGYWDVYPSVERPIRFKPMLWEEPKARNCYQEMTLLEFLEQMTEFNLTFKEFFRIRKKFGI